MALVHIQTDGTETGLTASDKINLGFNQIDTNSADILSNTTDITTNTNDILTNTNDIALNTLDLVKLNAIQNLSLEPTGFDLNNPIETGVIELCPVASEEIVYRFNYDNTFSKLTSQTTFGDGSPLVDRKFIQYPTVGQPSFSFWNKGNKFVKTTTQSIIMPLTSIKHIVCYDEQGDLVLANTVSEAITFDTLVSVITGHPLGVKKVVFGNERHGLQMSGATHLFEHETTGARIGKGSFQIMGLANNATEFTEIQEGTVYDEDLHYFTPAITSTIFAWRDGIGGDWLISDVANNKLGVRNSADDVSYNHYNGITDTWSLEGIGSDYVIMHFFGTNDGEYPIFKVVGQDLYPDRTTARLNLKSDVTNLQNGNLPSPEFVHLYSMIIHDENDGQIETGPDGEIYVDFRWGYPVSRF